MKVPILCLCLCLGLASCGAPAPVAAPVVVPPSLLTCPEGKPPPPPPPPPRTFGELVDWVQAVYAALLRTESARAVCATRLGKLNQLIRDAPYAQ